MIAEGARTPLAELAEASAGIAAADDLGAALDLLAAAVGRALRADAVVVRVRDADGLLAALAVEPAGSALAAELAGTTVPPGRLDEEGAPEATRRAADRVRAAGVLAVPARAEGHVVGSVEAVRISAPFDEREQAVAELAAAQMGLAVRLLRPDAFAPSIPRGRALGLAGDALAAGGDLRQAAQQAVLIAVEASGAAAGALWRGAPVAPELAAAAGLSDDVLHTAAELAAQALDGRASALRSDPRLPPELSSVAAFPLGQPPTGALQLFFSEERVPSPDELATLASFAARSAHALRQGAHADELAGELDRMRAVLHVTGAATSELSLSHTLETALDRIGALLGLERLGLYLSSDEQLEAAAGRSLPVGHLDVAAGLLVAAVGPLRARGVVRADVAGAEPALASVRSALALAGEPSAVGVPLLVRGEAIGLLAAWPGERGIAESDASLLDAIAAQLAVSVQNARLHERSQLLSEERSRALRSARDAGRRLAALYEISNAFAETLSLERTADAIAATVVGALGVDVALLRLPDGRGLELVARSLHVADERHRAALELLLARPQPVRLRRFYEPELVTVASAARLGGSYELLVPFLEQGSTAALIPIAGKGELLAELTILSLDPSAPITHEMLATGRTLAGQAALALENARLHQQLRSFAESMRQSLLPQEQPKVAGIEVGHRYESAAQVEVGGDVFDFLELPDGRLAVVLGDVTGHGVDAAAEMAMAKFVFRSLARQHPEPAAFLAHANDVVEAEIALGGFITLVYSTADPDGAFACASAGHPRPRLVHPDGRVEELHCGGLALGIAPDQQYEEERVQLERRAAVVLYTDGVVETRRDGQYYGIERLDAVLTAHASSDAQATADAVLADCRAFAGGEPSDDCAVVVIRRP
ncbi:MAG TPA: SpoIIE family protein phosphatase [Gaiellaceae bacterium]|nr:SpoIIE family protein phosphatase [Gaiellaceae bacterium]